MTSRNRWMLGLSILIGILALTSWWSFQDSNRSHTAPTVPDEASTGIEAEANSGVSLPIPQPAAQRAEADAGRSELLVTREDGTPVSQADVRLFNDAGLVWSGETDSGGRARFERSDHPARALIRAAGHAALVTVLDRTLQEATVVMPEAHSLRGEAQFDAGSSQLEPVLRLYSEANSAFVRGLPRMILRQLGKTKQAREGIRVALAADRSFMVRGLGKDDRVRMECDAPWFIDDGSGDTEKRLTEEAPLHAGVFVKVSRPFEFRLRVVRSDGVPAVVDSVEFRDGTKHGQMEKMAGEFVARLYGPQPRKVSVKVLPIGLEPEPFSQEFSLPQAPSAGWECAVFEVPAPASVLVEVVGSDGEPILEATPYLDPGHPGWPVSGALDKDSQRLKVESAPGAVGFFVTAEGHEMAWVEMPSSGRDTRVVLRRAASLSVVIPGVDAEQSGMIAMLRSWQPWSKYQRREEEPSQAPVDPIFQLKLGRVGSGWEESSLAPGIPFRLEVRDPQSKPASHALTGTALATVEIAPLTPGERRTVVVELDARPRTLKLHVVGPRHQNVHFVYVSTNGPNFRRRWGQRTNPLGMLELGPLYGDVVDLWVSANGFPMSVRRGIPVDAGEVTIVLEEFRSVEVEVIPARGTADLSKVFVAVEAEFHDTHEGTLRDGRWILDRLPPGEVTFIALSPECQVRQLHDTENPSARIVFGEPGKIVATYRHESGTFESRMTFAIAPAGQHRPTSRASRNSRETNGEYRFELEGLAPGAYDVWPERMDTDLTTAWSRAGPSKRVNLDADHPFVEVDLTP